MSLVLAQLIVYYLLFRFWLDSASSEEKKKRLELSPGPGTKLIRRKTMHFINNPNPSQIFITSPTFVDLVGDCLYVVWWKVRRFHISKDSKHFRFARIKFFRQVLICVSTFSWLRHTLVLTTEKNYAPAATTHPF